MTEVGSSSGHHPGPSSPSKAGQTEILLRKGQGTKTSLKEKFVAIYEAFFKGEDPSLSSPNFWDELSLLKVNIAFLERCVMLTSEDGLISMKDVLNKIFYHSLQAMKETNLFRKAHGMETMSTLLRSIFRKKFMNFGHDVLNVICGIEQADVYFKDLLETLQAILSDSRYIVLKDGAINMMLIIATAIENINQNTILEYFMLVDLFPSLIRVVMDAESSRQLVSDSVFLLTLLINYRKYESRNPYMLKSGQLDQHEALIGLALNLSDRFESISNTYRANAPPPGGVLTKVSSFFSSFFVAEASSGASSQPSNALSDMTGTTLMGLYEFVHLNKHFSRTSVSALVTETDSGPLLMKHFLNFCTFIVENIQDVQQAYYVKLAFLVILCLTEDNDACLILHDKDSGCIIPSIHEPKKPKHFKRPLITVVLDVLIQFLKTNLKKKMQYSLYHKSLSIIQHIICYEKKFRVQLSYNWKLLWDALFQIIKFISTPSMFSSPEVVQLSIEITTIFNLFITYGDTFLASPNDYDDLYYELIRNCKMLEVFCMTAESSEMSKALVQQLENIKTIIRHFTAKIDRWQEDHPGSALSQEQVVGIIRDNYETLKLNLLDGLDHYELYLENPKEVKFFQQFVRKLIFDSRALVDVHPIKLSVE